MGMAKKFRYRVDASKYEAAEIIEQGIAFAQSPRRRRCQATVRNLKYVLNAALEALGRFGYMESMTGVPQLPPEQE